MSDCPELRTAWSGAGPVNAAAWWRHADGSTSGHVWTVRDTPAEALAAVREMATKDCRHPALDQ